MHFIHKPKKANDKARGDVPSLRDGRKSWVEKIIRLKENPQFNLVI